MDHLIINSNPTPDKINSIVSDDNNKYSGTSLVLNINPTVLSTIGHNDYSVVGVGIMDKHKQAIDIVLQSYPGAQYDISSSDAIFRDDYGKLTVNLLCNNNHRFTILKSKLINGGWCKQCSNNITGKKNPEKATINRAIEYASLRGGRCLSTLCSSSTDNLEWECSYGHIWKAKFTIITRNAWCPTCGKASRMYAKSHVEEVINKKEGTLLSPYTNASTDIDIHCHRCNNIFVTQFVRVVQGEWCAYCYGNHRNTLEYCQEIADKRGGQLLSTTYQNNTVKMEWRCSNKTHPSWWASFNSIQSGTWCPHGECSGRTKLTLESCIKAAEKRGGSVLSTEYRNCYSNIVWKCKNQAHPPWTATATSILHYSKWCPLCRCSKGEQELTEILSKHNIVFKPQKEFHFSGKRRYDFFIPSINTVIEYDGTVHFIVSGHMIKTQEQLDYNHKVDSFKTNIARHNGYNIIRIDYTMLGKIERWLIPLLEIIQVCSAKSWLIFSNSGLKVPPPIGTIPKEIPRNPMYDWYDSTIYEDPRKNEELEDIEDEMDGEYDL